MADPITWERLAEIWKRSDKALALSEATCEPISQPALDRADLLAEVKRLRAELDDLRGQNAKTEDNFTSYAESIGADLADLREENERLRSALEEVRQRTVQRDLNRLAREALGETAGGGS